jgi:hypothetical protein
MIMSVSTLIILSGAATPSSTVNFSIDQVSSRMFRQILARREPGLVAV